MKEIGKITTILALFFSLLLACKDTPAPTPTDPCIGKDCGSDRTCNNGICSCPKGEFLYGTCYSSDTSFAAYGKSRIWGDTVLLLMNTSESTSRFYKFSLKTMDKTRHYTPRGGIGYAYRIQDAQGDSLAPYISINAGHFYMGANNEFLFPEYKGRFLDSSTLRLQITFCSMLSETRIKERVDSTTYLFKKLK